jgi:glycosyltransferase involved in cell wall biosynthesis
MHANPSAGNPFVSVVVPVYNSQETIESCLDSLVNLNYPKDGYEIIVVDDHSTDESADIVKSFAYAQGNIRLLRQSKSKKGPAAARNLGIRHAKGEIIAFTDSDCIVPQDWLEKISLCFSRHKEYSAIGGTLISCASKKFITVCEGILSDCIGHRALIAAPNSAFRKKALIEAGLFDEALVSGEDPDLVWNLEKRGHKISFLKDLPVVHHYYRSTFRSFVKHHLWYGRGRVLLVKRHPEKFSFAERHFLWIIGLIAVISSSVLAFRNSFMPWAIAIFLSFMLFSFARRANLLTKIAEEHGPANSIKCSLLFPIIDMANLYGMTIQKFGLK